MSTYTELIPPGDTQCRRIASRDRMCKCNGVNKEWMITSFDVEALYLNLDIPESSRVIEEIMKHSDFKVEGLRWTEIALYLRSTT